METHAFPPRRFDLSTKPGPLLEPGPKAGLVPVPSAPNVREQLARILASPCFAESDRMRRFLTLVVDEKLKGRPGRLKEVVIGIEVFDKKPPYDPRLDPIVRVEARRLRAKLVEYYEGHGRADALLIELPKGSYSPVFRF